METRSISIIADTAAKAAKCFLCKTLNGLKNWEKPEVINTDKAPTYGIAISELKAEGKCPEQTVHRQVKYLNNVIVRISGGKEGKFRAAVIRSYRWIDKLKLGLAGLSGFGGSYVALRSQIDINGDERSGNAEEESGCHRQCKRF